MDLCNLGNRNARRLSISFSLVIIPSYIKKKKKTETFGILKDMKKRELWCKLSQLMGELDDCRETSSEVPLGKSLDPHTMRSLLLYIYIYIDDCLKGELPKKKQVHYKLTLDMSNH